MGTVSKTQLIMKLSQLLLALERHHSMKQQFLVHTV